MCRQLHNLRRLIPWLLLASILCALITLLASCRSTKTTVSSTHTDTQTNVHTEVRRQTIYVPDTVYIEIPKQTAEQTIRDSTSMLENSYALSMARINPDGSLYHTLETKPQSKPVGILKPVERKDSIVYVDKVVTKKEVQTIKVEKKLPWWQRALMFVGGVAILLLLLTYAKK